MEVKGAGADLAGQYNRSPGRGPRLGLNLNLLPEHIYSDPVPLSAPHCSPGCFAVGVWRAQRAVYIRSTPDKDLVYMWYDEASGAPRYFRGYLRGSKRCSEDAGHPK